MAFRIEAAALACVTMAAPALAQELRYEVWHGHSRPPHIRKAGNPGTLSVTEKGISFVEHYLNEKKPKRPHAWQWAYQDIRQLTVGPRSITVLTYKDNGWKLGADRTYRFDLTSGNTFDEAFAMFRGRLDQRFVAALPDAGENSLWVIPVKHLSRMGGDQGVLKVGPDGVVYESTEKGESRTWRYQDIESVSSSGPFQLTVTTFERARMQYGSRKGFNFQLKERLLEGRYNELWQRVNQAQGLKVLTAYR